MTLGTAARSSTTNVSAPEARGGASSDRKMAQPRPSGAAMISATKDVTTVPYMNGSAPNSPVTGFQSCVNAKDQPNLARDRLDAEMSSYSTSAVRSNTPAANRNVIR